MAWLMTSCALSAGVHSGSGLQLLHLEILIHSGIIGPKVGAFFRTGSDAENWSQGSSLTDCSLSMSTQTKLFSSPRYSYSVKIMSNASRRKLGGPWLLSMTPQARLATLAKPSSPWLPTSSLPESALFLLSFVRASKSAWLCCSGKSSLGSRVWTRARRRVIACC